MTDHFLDVTELPGGEMTQEQLERLCHRYYWAAQFVRDRDVLEVACGAGPGLRYLAERARSVKAGDFSPLILAQARLHAGEGVELKVFDAQDIPYRDGSFDLVIIYEALYYIPSAERFVAEARRVLRPGGVLLISCANKDLYDFNPSPFSTVYYGVVELQRLLAKEGFTTSFFGYHQIGDVSLWQRVLRPIKKIAVDLNLIPKTMAGKRLLKRLVFGRMVRMPSAVADGLVPYIPPEAIDDGKPDVIHKIIYCSAGVP